MSKSDIILEDDGNDSNGQLGTHALKATIQGLAVNFPTISPVQTELDRAENRKMNINSLLATFTDHVTSLNDFLENYDEINRPNYVTFARENPNKIVNYSFNLHPNENTNEEVVRALRDVQLYAQSPFLFEYENDINQDVSSLSKQLVDAKNWLIKKGSKKFVVPVIDMRIRKEGLFLEKLESLSEKYNRINVIYRSPLKVQSNWADLKAFLKDNKIWCHMDCVLNRYDGDKIAHRVRLYAIGISSSSLGFPFGGNGSKKKKKIYRFNSESHTYELVNPPHIPSFAERKDRTWITSLNDEVKELQNMRENTVNKTLYSEYLPPKGGPEYLAFSEGI